MSNSSFSSVIEVHTPSTWADLGTLFAGSMLVMALSVGVYGMQAMAWLGAPLSYGGGGAEQALAFLGLLVSVGFVALDVVKKNLGQGQLTKMDMLLIVAIALVGTHVYITALQGFGNHISAVYLFTAVAFVFRLALIVHARDVVRALTAPR